MANAKWPRRDKNCAIPTKEPPVAGPGFVLQWVMKTFLVPVDFSAVTEKVIESALAQARAFRGHVALLHVIQPPVSTGGEYALPVEVVEEAVETNKRAGLQKLEGRREAFRAAGIECSIATAVGVPDRAILEEAARVGADCIIMGSHGHGRLYDFLVGSTASGVIKRAKCAVLVIPPADKHG